MTSKNIIRDVIAFVKAEADFSLSESEAYNIIKFIMKIKYSDFAKKGGKKSKRKLTKEEASRMGKLSAEKRKQNKEQKEASSA